MSLHQIYMNTLTPWVAQACKEVVICPDRPDLGYYGDGTNSWGVQTNQKALAAFGIAATDPLFDEEKAGISKDALLAKAFACLRYSLATHLSGEYHLTNGPTERWGHTWISVLGIERMVFALDAMMPFLTDTDKANVRRVFLSEADFLLTEYPIKAGLVDDNKPESNMWNGAFLLRCALMYPDCIHKDLYMEKGRKLILNAISIPSQCDESWFVGANFFESFATNHHHYMNVGYMVITLSQLAYLHFTYKRYGVEPPAFIYTNAKESWDLVRKCIFPDGRLLRIGGDSRIRYCYCQDFLNVVLALAADYFDENTAVLEDGWQKLVQKEQAENNDGTYLSTRVELFRERAPLYFARLESDRAVSAAQGAYLHRMWPELAEMGEKKSHEEPFQWHDDYHGACFVRNKDNMSSFIWISAEKPQGLCLPLCDSSMAEWNRNMTSMFEGDGLFNEHLIQEHHETMLDGGFVTTGRTIARTWTMLDESKSEEKNVELSLLYAALPDGATTVTLQYAEAIRHCHLLKVKGLHLNVPNDLFNDYKRDYICDGKTVCIDNRLGLTSIYGDPLTVYHNENRTIGLKDKYCYGRGMLKVDEIFTTYHDSPRWYENGDCILDFGTAIRAGADSKETARFAEGCRVLTCSDASVRTVCVEGADGKQYTVIFNISKETVSCTVEGVGPVTLEPCEGKILF